eukprot:c13617_g1_i1.p1 GENE.c13617_g1_i1~~c13617_g1_i1.p1  ORF type:complete len:144 (+),score=24.68 c13617_g1_i1:100-531(+)
MNVSLLIKVTGIACSLFLIIIAILSLVSYGVRGFLLHVYVIGFCSVLIIVELEKANKKILHHFPFIQSHFGRACVYLFTASMVLVYAYHAILHAIGGFLALFHACGYLWIVFTRPASLAESAPVNSNPKSLASQDHTAAPPSV